MKQRQKSIDLLLSAILAMVIIACQSITPQPTNTPTSTSSPVPTATSISPTFTSTPTVSTEEETWRKRCVTTQERGRIGDGIVNDISYSKGGKLVSVATGGGLALYNLERQSQIWFSETTAPIIQAVFINNDTDIVALDKDLRLIRFSTKGGWIIDSTDPVDAMNARLSDDGSMVMLADWLGITYVYDTTKFEVVASTEEYIKKNETITLFMSDLVYWNILFSPNSNLFMTAAFTGRITFFDSKTGKAIREYPLETRAFPENASFSGDGKYLAIEYKDENQTTNIRILSITNGYLKQSFQGTNPALSKDGKLLASRDKNKIMIWQVSNGKLINEFNSQGHLIGNVKFGMEENTLVSSSGSGLEVWNINDGTLLETYLGDFSDYQQVMTGANNAVIALRSDYHIETRDVKSGETIAEINSDNPIYHIALNREGTQLAGVSGDQVIIWNPTNGEIIKSRDLGSRAIFVAFTSNPDEFIIGDGDSQISLLTLDDGKTTPLVATPVDAHRLAATLDGSLVAVVGSENTINIINSREGNIIKTINQGDNGVGAFALSPDGTILAFSASDKNIYLRSIEGKLICKIKDQPESIESLSFSSDGLNLYIIPQSSGYAQMWGVTLP